MKHTEGKLQAQGRVIVNESELWMATTCFADTADRVVGHTKKVHEKEEPEFCAELVHRWNCHEELVTACERALTLLRASSRFVKENPVSDYTVQYDDARCDGNCLDTDCEIAASEIDTVLSRAKERP